jgi:hypothetical protein
VLFGGGLLLLGAIPLSAGWSGAGAALILTGTVLCSYASMVFSSWLRLPPVVPALAWLMAVAAAGFVAGTQAGIGGLEALRDGVQRLLTAPRPAPGALELLLPGIMLTVLIGVWVGARVGRSGSEQPYGQVSRPGWHVAPLVGAAVLYVAGALLTAGTADRYGVVAAALVLTAMLGWALSERRSSRGAGRLAAVVAATTLTVATAVAVTLAVLPLADPFEPRRLVAPPAQPFVERNPLPRLAALATQNEPQFRHTAGSWRLHLVALTDFDGNSWRADAVYRPLGAVGAASLPPGMSRTVVTADITIETLEGPWLPAAGVPNTVSIPGVGVDEASGSLVINGGARPGLHYAVRGLVDTPPDEALLVARVPAEDRYLRLPRLPFLFRDHARQVVQGAATPFEQAVLIERDVRQGRHINQSAPAGSSYARLETFLFGQTSFTNPQPGAQAGTSEQFATAFAVLARSVGLPTRVVFGFGPGEQQPDGTWMVRGRDALAWPEVYFSGLGWVPFDPSPEPPDTVGPSDQTRQVVLDRVGGNRPSPQPTPSHQPVPDAPGQPPDAPGGDAAAPTPLGGDGDAMVRLLVVALVTLVVVPGTLVVARWARRRRHHRAGAAGAWSEVLDMLAVLDRTPPAWHSAVRIAHDVAAAYPTTGPHPALRLAEAADRSAFSPRDVRVAVPWAELRRLREAVRRRTPLRRRLTWPIDPRPFRRRS